MDEGGGPIFNIRVVADEPTGSGFASAPSGAVAVRLDLELGNPEGTAFTAQRDEVEISVDHAVIMADGFESGAGGAWTVGAP